MPKLNTAAHGGVYGLKAKSTVPKQHRAKVLMQGAIVHPEKDRGYENYQAVDPSDPANALMLKAKPNRPRGSERSWSFGVPAIRQGGKYVPLLDSATGNSVDYEDVTATPIVNGRIGNPPDGTIALLVDCTEHGNPETLALHSGGGGGPGGDLIAQHEGNSPPQYSSHVAEITGDQINTARTAGLHSLMRVRTMLGSFCQPKTSSSRPTGPNSLFINATKSVGDHTGWFPATYTQYDALHSHEVDGNLRPATTHHLLGYTPEGRAMVPGANDCDTLFTRGDPKFDAPLEILDQYEPEYIGEGVFPVRTWCMVDRDATHPFRCDPNKPQLRRWHTPLPVTYKPSCFGSRDTVASDSNGNPGRTFPTGPEVYAPTMYEGTGMRFISRPNILRGQPKVPHSGKGAA
jgi:hypothetical protein